MCMVSDSLLLVESSSQCSMVSKYTRCCSAVSCVVVVALVGHSTTS